MVKKKNSRKYKVQALVHLTILIAIILLLNVISTFVYSRLDLTEDNRYTLGYSTKQMMQGLDDIVYIKVYLEGELPAGFRKLQESTRELLDELEVYSGGMVQYEFIDPLAGKDAKDKRYIMEQLQGQGLEPVDLEVAGDEQTIRKVIFPGAILTYRNRSVPVSLFENQMGMAPLQVLHNSEVGLEYQLANALRRVRNTWKPDVAFIHGHGELDTIHTADLRQELRNYYRVSDLNLTQYKVEKLQEYEVAIVAKPDTTFSEVDKFKIDQFIMNGGKVLWLIDRLKADLRSLGPDGTGLTNDYPLNITEDLLFGYGVRINPDLVQSMQAGFIPIVTGTSGGRPQTSLKKWVFYPLAGEDAPHPIVKNSNPVMLKFSNSLDTVKVENVEKTVLLSTSPNSRLVYNPVRINLQMVRENPNPALFNKGQIPVAILLEGNFTSVFRNRLAPQTLESGQYGDVREKSDTTAMIVVSDGDVASSQISPDGRQVLPLGYDRYTNQTFGNKTFILNCIDYLAGHSGLLALRTKEIRMRMLDQARVKENKVIWQVINTVLPLVFLILFGIIYNYVRKRKYS
ncbi:MAG: gliding motility-associated ABC transporter substrate-binding protein GldG [Bacteroidia bacterium]